MVISSTKSDSVASETSAPIPGLSGQVKLTKPLEQRRIKLIRASESDMGNLWAAILPAGMPFSAVLSPGLWSNAAARLNVGDTIEIHCDDQSFFGRVLVRQLGGAAAGKLHTHAGVAKLEYHEFDQPTPSDNALSHKVEHKGPHLKWCVIRIADGKVVADSHASKDTAETAMKSFLHAV
jgi:hypothetical protein